jgi:hypothetical protein
LHEPSVEIQGKIINIDNENNLIKKSTTKKKVATKKTRVKKKSETKKGSDVKETGKIKYIKKELKDKKDNKYYILHDTKFSEKKVSETKNEESDVDDKTGWWS